ncbi:hypothetical protein N7478_008209 [Penicillium angulare]|uniref:uncharacterized protein n=1 Tax=Penicillium angulare TaxID=116970 RepID=UPI00254243F9|nr:uncharacterized protein N7478_008209 [Penicillium angulare]KAJ5273084.1 hypothetical protein N7478_008209 [Penicillium angulare]
MDLQTSSEPSRVRKPRVRKSRGRGLRTTNGCITCRKRHLKCDEVKPICGACAKKGSACDFPTSQSRLRAKTPPPSNQSISVTSPRTPVQTPSALGTNENFPTTNQTYQSLFEPDETTGPTWPGYEADNNPSPSVQDDQFVERDPVLSHSPVAFQHAFLSPSNASTAALRWFGLLANDAARDNLQDSTVHHSWANESLSLDDANSGGQNPLTSLQRATRVLDSPAAYADHDPTQVDASGNSTLVAGGQIWQSREPIQLLTTETKLLEHFINRVSPWIYNAGLMNAIIALSSRHLALNPKLDDQNMPKKDEQALQYYYQTLHYVQKAMKYSGYKTSLELLATTLIISAYEMLDNSTKDWERHLEGVFLIQRSQVIHGESGGLHSAVWWAWLCQDIWAAFREKRKTLTFWVPQKPLSVLSPHELAARSIYNTAKVISYCADITTQANILRRIDEGIHLDNVLDEWHKHLAIEFSPLPFSGSSHSYCPAIWIRPPSFAVAVQFYNVSKLLLLAHEPNLGGIDQHLERQSRIKGHTENIYSIALTLTDNPSSVMSSQALYIAGLFTMDLGARDLIIELLDSSRERSGWPVKSLGKELKRFWEWEYQGTTTGAEVTDFSTRVFR